MLPVIAGRKINLRPLRSSDIPSLVKHAGDREISRYTFIPHPYRKEHAEQFIKMSRLWERKGIAQHFGIELKQSGEIIGAVGLFDLDKRNQKTEIGYWLGMEYWGKGVASEAVSLVVQYCFRTLKLHRVYAHVFVGNVASERLLLRLGFQWEGLERDCRRRRGRWMDSILYAILKSEFKMSRVRTLQSHLSEKIEK